MTHHFTAWQCAVAHTSAVAPTTFSADRVAHPTYWASLSVFPAVDYLPTINDTTSLGSLTQRFANLFLKSGGTINFGTANYIITHIAGLLTFSGSTTFAAGNVTFNDGTINYRLFVQSAGEAYRGTFSNHNVMSRSTTSLWESGRQQVSIKRPWA